MSIKTTKELHVWVDKLARRINGASVAAPDTHYGARIFYVIGSGAIYRVAKENEYGDALNIKVLDEVTVEV